MLKGSEQLALRLRQNAERADRMDIPVPGRFVTGEERAMAIHAAREARVAASFDGGWPDAERVQVCFHPAWAEAEFTAVWLEIRWAAVMAASPVSAAASAMAVSMYSWRTACPRATVCSRTGTSDWL